MENEEENVNRFERHVEFKYNDKKVFAVFHQWGNTLFEGNNGELIPMTCAVVESYTGEVYTPFASEIKFVEKENELDKYRNLHPIK